MENKTFAVKLPDNTYLRYNEPLNKCAVVYTTKREATRKSMFFGGVVESVRPYGMLVTPEYGEQNPLMYFIDEADHNAAVQNLILETGDRFVTL